MPVEAQAARHLEAAGVATTTFEFRGAAVTIPLPVERWPLDDIRAGRSGRAIKALLGEQRPPMRTRADVVELSHRMADAVGVTPLPESPADPKGMFGAIPTLLRIVDNYGDDLEADLRRFFGVDYRAGVTLRQVWVYARRMPVDSALLVARNGGTLPWSRGEVINARVWEMWTRKRYPGRPPSKEEIDEWRAQQAVQSSEMDRLAEREEYYRSGQNMRDAGVEPGPRPPKQSPQQSSDDPVERALEVAVRNARRTPKGRGNDGRTPGIRPDGSPGFTGRRWNTAGSGW